MMMQGNQHPQQQRMADRSARSVFVGNIAYEVSEAQIRQVFNQVGPVVHIRLLNDHDTGRPKGYGFIEFADAPTADAAIRNMNGYELNGRALRVDSATGGERSTEEVQQFERIAEPLAPESPYGPEPEAGKAPEAIARTVASMAPERMYSLMREMKETVLKNPTMARHLLMDNPQLAYALLQAQVVMRVVDPKVAYSMLHREQQANLQPFHQQAPGALGVTPPQVGYYNPAIAPPPQQLPQSSSYGGFVPPQQQQQQLPTTIGQQLFRPPMMNVPPPGMALPPMRMPPPIQPQQPQSSSNDKANEQASTTAEEEEKQARMLVQVLNLTDEQINLLPQEDRAKVIELRNQLRKQVPSAN